MDTNSTEKQEVKWYEYIFKKVPEEDYVKWYQALILFFILFIVLFIIFSIFEMQGYSDYYDKTSYTVDMFGRRHYKTIKGSEPDFYNAEIFAFQISVFLSILTYVTNYMHHFRKLIFYFLKKLFSLF